MKTFKFSIVLRTRENIDVLITHDETIYGIHSKIANILYISSRTFGQIISKGGWVTNHSYLFPCSDNILQVPQ